jgi:mRNA-degrading endonuclease RelE of RelBE toxin-antitoxin system
MQFVYLPVFVKRLKELSKKYISIKNDFSSLLKELEENPESGTSLGKGCYKVRLAIKSKNRGKSGGARIITHVKIESDTVYFLTIYDNNLVINEVKIPKSNIFDGNIYSGFVFDF